MLNDKCTNRAMKLHSIVQDNIQNELNSI